MKSKFRTRLLVATIAVSLPAAARGADLYWDANGADAGTGGTGTWNTALALWRAGSETGALQAWSAGNVAVLGGTAGALTMGAATTTNGITVLAATTGTTYNIATTTANLLSLAADAAIQIPDGKTLAFTGAGSGQVIGGNVTTFVGGGGTLAITGSNRVFLGTFDVSGTGTTLRVAGTNALDNNSWSTGLNIRNGATVEVTGTNNYRRTAFLDGGTFRCGHIRSLQAQTNSFLTVNGTAGAKSVVANARADGDPGGLAGNGSTARVVTVNATGDPGGIDLEYQAGWRNGTFNKAGDGKMLITSTGIFNRNDNYTTPNSGSNALSVNAGTAINEGTIMSPAAVSGTGLLTHGATTGVFDQVTINAGGVFEIGRLTGLFNDAFVHAAGQSDLYLNGGTLRYATGFSEDVSALLPAVGAAGGAIDTNGNDILFSTPLAGAGTLAKKGAGSLTLAGSHTIAGVGVEEGALKLAPGASLAGTTVTLKAAGQLDATGGMVFPNGVLANEAHDATDDVAGNLTLGADAILRPGGRNFDDVMVFGGDLMLDGTFEVDITDFGLDSIEVGGNLDVSNGSFRINLATAAPLGGVVATYGGTLTGTPKLSGYLAASRYAPALVHNPGAKTIELTISGGTGPLALTWTGAEGGEWDLATTQKNFTRDAGGIPDTFKQLDSVIFPNSATTTTATLSGEIAPGALVFNHTDIDYTLTGTGSIAGLTSLVKNGDGKLTIATDNTYAGGTTVNAGRIDVGTGGATGSLGSGPITNDGVIAFNRSADLTLSAAVSGNGALSFAGGALFTLAETNTYTGGTTLLAGTLKQGKAGAIPAPAAGNATVTIASGATLDLGGFALAGTAAMPVVVSGPGTAANAGAVINSGGGLFSNGISFLALAGDTAIGNDGARFDLIGTAGAGGIISTDPLAPRKLTKVGGNQISLKTDDYSGISELVVEAGTIGVESDNLGAPTRPITIQAAGAVSLWGGRTVESPVTLNGGILRSDNATTNLVTGDMELAATSTISGAGSTGLTVTGVISGTGALLKDGAADLTLANDNTYTGGTSLRGTGRLILTADGALGTTGAVELAGGAASQLTLGAGGMTLNRPVTIKSGGRVNEGTIYASQAGTATMAGDITLAGAHNAGGTFGSAAGAELVIAGKVTQAVQGLDPMQPTVATPVRVSVRNGTVRFDNPANDFRWLYLSENTVKLGEDNALPTGAVFSLGDNANAAVFDLNGHSQELRSLARWGNTGATTIRNTGAEPSVLTFNTDFTGCAQLETALANGSATADGEVSVTVTGQGIAGSPLVIDVPVATGDTPEAWAGKVRAGLAAAPEITALYEVTGTGNQISLERKTPAPNDGTLNIALANGAASPGITAAATSANASPGVSPFYAGNITGDLSLVKTGPETLTLGGTFTHSGTTAIQQGKLLLNATHTGGGDYTVSSNAILAGNGNTTATVQVNGTLSAGDTDTLGALNTGSLNLNAGSSLVVNLNTTDVAADYIRATGDVTLSGTVLLTITDANPAPLALGTSLQVVGHTGAWSGTLTYVGAPVPDEGVITVGPNHFRVKYHDTTPATPAMTLTAVAGATGNYASWAAANNVTGGPGGDSDQDGIPNLTEYALATNINGSDGSVGTFENGTLTFTKRAEAVTNGDLTYVIETSGTLAPESWIPAVTHGPGNTSATIAYPLPTGQGRIFARLAVTQTP